MHYWKDEDKNILLDTQKCTGPPVNLPNSENIYATQQGNLPLSKNLAKKAKIAKILPELRSFSLLSLVQLCDDDCDIRLNKKKMHVIKDKELILQGTRKKLDGLWDVPVYKTELSSDNFGTTTTNAALYIKQETRAAKLFNKPAINKKEQFKTSTSNTFCTEFQDMNQLVEFNECNMLVSTQLKEDRIYDTIPLTKVHKMSVIIRKKQIHSDFGSIFSCSLFLPS